MAKTVEADVVLACGEHLPAVDVWIVIDVLRATTVITRWFELGGRDLYPVGSSGAARNLARDLASGGASPLLMGEENAIPPEGFDLGNSPLDLSREVVRAHSCAVMSTSNGTVALLSAAATGVPVLAACIRNASAALDHALTLGSRIGLLCAGRKQRPGWDDTLCAGLLLHELQSRYPDILLADGARLSLLAWRSSGNFLQSMRSADHAVFLDHIGYGEDIVFACEQDAASVVPVLHEEPNGEDGMRAVLRSVTLPPHPRRTETPLELDPSRGASAEKPKPDPFAPFLRYTGNQEEEPRYFFLGGNSRRHERKLDLAEDQTKGLDEP